MISSNFQNHITSEWLPQFHFKSLRWYMGELEIEISPLWIANSTMCIMHKLPCFETISGKVRYALFHFLFTCGNPRKRGGTVFHVILPSWHINTTLVPPNFFKHGLIPACISNHMPSKVLDEITYPFPNFKGCTYIYMSYNITHIRNAYIYIYILTQSFWTGTKVIRRKHIIQTAGFV